MDGVACLECDSQKVFAQTGGAGETERIGEAVVVEHGGQQWTREGLDGCGQPGLENLDSAGHELCAGGGVGDVAARIAVEELLGCLECCGYAGDVHSGAEFLVEAGGCGFLGRCRRPPGVFAGPADGDDEEGEEDVEEAVLAAGDVAVGVVEEADHVAAAVAVQAAGDEPVGNDGGVVGALHRAFDDFAVVVQGCGDAGDGEVAVVGEEEADFDVRGEVVEDHLAVGGFPVFGTGFCLVVGGFGVAAIHVHWRPPYAAADILLLLIDVDY